MNELDILDKKIENYVHKRMDESERMAFEEELKTNNQLRENIRSLIALVELYNAELFDLKKKLDGTEEELHREKFFDADK